MRHLQGSGILRAGRRTKELLWRLQGGEVVLLDHRNMDGATAWGLVSRCPRAILNASRFLDGTVCARGPAILLASRIPLLEGLGEKAFRLLPEGKRVEVRGNRVFLSGRPVMEGDLFTPEVLARRWKAAEERAREFLPAFLSRSLYRALEDLEKIDLLSGSSVPPPPRGLPPVVLLVARGEEVEEDARTLLRLLRLPGLFTVGVDGGADLLLRAGARPDLVVGDMDSASPSALRMARMRLAHAYPDGRSPGAERLRSLGLDFSLLPCPGTSEDAALLLADRWGFALAFTLGFRRSAWDFMEKGRPGMASTILVRLGITIPVIEADRLALLFPEPLSSARPLALAAALLPPFFLGLTSPLRELLRLWWVGMRLALGI